MGHRILPGILTALLACAPVLASGVGKVPQLKMGVGSQGGAAGAGVNAQGPGAGLVRSGLPASLSLPSVLPSAKNMSPAAGAQAKTETRAVGKTAPRAPVVSLEQDYRLFHKGGGEGVVYKHKDSDVLVKVFSKVKGVTPEHVRALVRISEGLRGKGLPVVPMEAVDLGGGNWGVRMPLVKGLDLQAEIDRLNPDGILTDPTAARLQSEAFAVLKAIDAETGGLADRARDHLGEVEGFVNFVRRRDGGIIDIDPISMDLLVKKMGQRPAQPAPDYGQVRKKVGSRLSEVSGRLGRGEAESAADLASFRGAEKGGSRRDWTFDGVKAEWLDGGGFKDILIHPEDADYLITMFSQAGAKDTLGSVDERDRERNRRKRLEGLSPKVVSIGRLPVTWPDGSERVLAYFVQERVRGTPLRRASAKALPLVRALFGELVRRRVRLEDEVHLLDNIMIGRAPSDGTLKAYVLDAGEAEYAGERSWKDRLMRRPDPLKAYYDRLYERVERELSRSG